MGLKLLHIKLNEDPNADQHGSQEWENKMQASINAKLKYVKLGKLSKPKNQSQGPKTVYYLNAKSTKYKTNENQETKIRNMPSR